MTILALGLALGVVAAGDDSSGPIQYSVDLGAPYSSYQLTDADKQWAARLANNLKYSGRVVHFVRTSLELEVDTASVRGAVYQAVEEPTVYYVVPGDALLRVGNTWPVNPSVGGFSLHAPKSMDFIACLNLTKGGVPFLSGTPVVKGRVSWKGHEWKRF
jgi:hypothetical protein